MSSSDFIQLAGLIGALLGVLGTAIWWFLRQHLNKLHRRIRTLEDQNEELQTRAEQTRPRLARLESANLHLQNRIKQLAREAEARHRQLGQAVEMLRAVRAKGAELRAERH